MQASLAVIIERSREARDQRVSQAHAAGMAVQQAQAVLQQLQGYRLDYLRRSPSAPGLRVRVEQLVEFQRFVAKLDEAIGLQGQELALRRQRELESQRLLAEAQRRLLAFEALLARHADERARLARRREQRDTDEFAAQAARRMPAHERS
ncbi:flagellar export protein FliJ [Ramlibacter sp. AW1]|uniref:Flagellar FliJ protein n=1 Tax=Ramlibacter aurantiacus TaxID=2801330 RepID=A0A936ZVR5_9BURK|nr:flagellar export protein FliJ [Ramlibacter aurantiacus]MBL0421454.1 flagellar export protein FliJ [Ramlibacter aurantiacus]